MSDTTSCSSCGATAPGNAKFCTTCGQAMAGDATNVDQPRPDSPTQVQPPVDAGAPPAWANPPASPTAPSQPWAPADQPTSAPPGSTGPPQAPAWGQAPPTAPAAAPPSWQHPPAAPGAGAPPAWGQPPGQAPAWGQTPAAAPTARKGKAPSPLGGIVAVIGGVLTLVGIFTAWVGNSGGDSITGWDLTSGDKILKSNDPYILLALAIVALAIGVVRFGGAMAPLAKVAALVVGVVIIAIMIRDWLSIVDVVKKLSSDVKVEQKFGYFLAIAGGGLTALSALMPSAGKKSA